MERDQAVFLVLQYIQSLKDAEAAETESLDTVSDLLSTAFNLKLDDVETSDKYSLPKASLPELLEAGVESLGVKTPAQELEELKDNPLFQQFLATVTKKGFFKGTEEGTPEYKARHRKMVVRFMAKLEDQKRKEAEQAAEAGAADLPPVPPPAPSRAESGGADTAAKAEKFKEQGNDCLRNKDYDGAAELYSQAIECSPNGPKSHIYFANRAAARHYLKQYRGAIDDCEAAIERDESYAKAHSRLGLAHAALSEWPKSIKAHQRALELDPTNKQTPTYIKQAEAKMRQGQVAAPGAGGAPGGMPDMAAMQQAMAGMGGGGQNPMAAMMQNPAMMQQAMKMMQNMGGGGGMPGMPPGGLDPSALAEAQAMMQDPAAMQAAMAQMNAMGGGGGGMGGGGGDSPFVNDERP